MNGLHAMYRSSSRLFWNDSERRSGQEERRTLPHCGLRFVERHAMKFHRMFDEWHFV